MRHHLKSRIFQKTNKMKLIKWKFIMKIKWIENLNKMPCPHSHTEFPVIVINLWWADFSCRSFHILLTEYILYLSTLSMLSTLSFSYNYLVKVIVMSLLPHLSLAIHIFLVHPHNRNRAQILFFDQNIWKQPHTCPVYPAIHLYYLGRK